MIFFPKSGEGFSTIACTLGIFRENPDTIFVKKFDWDLEDSFLYTRTNDMLASEHFLPKVINNWQQIFYSDYSSWLYSVFSIPLSLFDKFVRLCIDIRDENYLTSNYMFISFFRYLTYELQYIDFSVLSHLNALYTFLLMSWLSYDFDAKLLLNDWP